MLVKLAVAQGIYGAVADGYLVDPACFYGTMSYGT